MRVKSLIKKIFYKKGINKNKRIIRDVPRVTLSMIIKNEEHRFLKEVLNHASLYVDNIVIIDDCSSDKSVQLCKKTLRNFPHKIIITKESLFSKEYKLRMLQWKETIKTNPDWILFLDADEIFEDRIIIDIKNLIKNKDVDVYKFRLYDMWNEEFYRDDNLWNAHRRYKPFLIRYQPKFKYIFNKFDQHCGRLPKNINELNTLESDIRLKHFGWSRLNDRKQKYLRYKKMDPKSKYGVSKQYESILDENPSLNKF